MVAPDRIVVRRPNGTKLDPGQTLAMRVPAAGGFAWGYRGDRPLGLAYALLLDRTGDRVLAARLAPRFEAEVVARWPMPRPGDAWTLPVADLDDWIARSRGPGTETR